MFALKYKYASVGRQRMIILPVVHFVINPAQKVTGYR